VRKTGKGRSHPPDAPHRLPVAREADRIVVMGKGRIREIGARGKLLRQGGAYMAPHAGQLV